MLKKLIRFSVASPWMVILIAIGAGWAGWYSLQQTPVDAFPDISENQVIVFTEWMGRSPQDVEDQVTYPLSTEMQGIPGVKEVRAMSGFGFSQIYVVFKDDVDFYWARTRVDERLSTVRGELPEGADPQLGPEATALGQIFWYTIEGPGYDLGTLRSLQDFYVKYALQSVDGVAEVASVGGYVRQYQVDVDPNRLKAYNVSLSQVIQAVKRGNVDVGAKTIEENGLEAIVRGVGFIESVEDVENLVVTARHGTPVYVKNVATVQLGPDFRRGALADQHGERVGGVVAMRFGANPQEVIDGVKERLKEVQAGLPEGVKVVPFYDRTQLIQETMGTLTLALSQELLITLVVVLLFLLHVRTSLIVAVTLPVAVLMAFIAMRFMGLGADIMSLSGIAIAIGTMVDMGIIMSENIFSRLTDAERSHPPPPPDSSPPGGDTGDDGDGSVSGMGALENSTDQDAPTEMSGAPDAPGEPLSEEERDAVIVDAANEVAPAIMTAVTTTVVSFLPVFFLTGQSGKLFKPLAWTKTFAMIAALILAISLIPGLCRLFMRNAESNRRRLTAIAVAAFAAIGFLIGWQFPMLGIFSGVQPWITGAAFGSILSLVGLRANEEQMRPIEENVVSRWIVKLYVPALVWVLNNKVKFAALPIAVILGGMLVFFGARTLISPLDPLAEAADVDLDQVRVVAWLDETFPGTGSEFMPPLDEGSYLAMPSLLPQASLNETMDVMQTMNKEIASIPEVDQVVGKLGRAETALDPAPIGMMETIVNLKPPSQWREGITRNDILQELKRKSRIIGTTPSWLQPIETRIVMLQSGLRATMALRLRGAPRKPDGTPYVGDEALKAMEDAVVAMEDVVRGVDGAVDVTALRLGGKPYVEFHVDREETARYGINVRDVQDVIETAIGGMNLTWSVEGRERYPIRVQYQRELRDALADLETILVPTPSGAKVPISELAEIKYKMGPAAIRTENGQLTAYLMFNAFDRDESAVMNDAIAAVDAWREKHKAEMGQDPVPAGLTLSATGRYKNKIEADKRLTLIIPIVLIINFFLIFLQFRRVRLTATIFAAIPVAFAGGFILIGLYPNILDLLHWIGLRDQPSGGPIYLTTAVWVGFIALFGIAVDDGVVIGTYLKQVFERVKPGSVEEVRAAVLEAGKRRIRPMLMTTTTTILALMPILWSTGRGSDLMQPMALPLVGGMVFAFVTVFVVPAVYSALKEQELKGDGSEEVT